MASLRQVPQNSASGLKPPQTSGRSGESKISHCKFCVKCGQGTPPGLPSGSFGKADEILGTIQARSTVLSALHKSFFSGLQK